MTFALYLIAAALVTVAYALHRVELAVRQRPAVPGPQGAPGLPGPPGPAAQAVSAAAAHPQGPIRKDLARVFKRGPGGQWEHHGFVETLSEAYHEFFAKPGYAVQRHGEDIDPGKQ